MNYHVAHPNATETPNNSVKREKRDVEMAQEEELSSEEEGQMGVPLSEGGVEGWRVMPL